jgi:integrase
MDRGIFQDRSEAERNTLGDILKRYSEDVSPKKKSGKLEQQRIAKLLKDNLSQYKAAALNGKLLSQWRDMRLKEVSGSTVNRELNLIGHAINVARREWGIVLDNPISMIQRPKENKGRNRRLAWGELERLLNELEQSGRDSDGTFTAGGCRNIWVKPIVEFAIETAMRRGEILSLQWRHINLGKRTALLPDTKNGDSRTVPLSSKAISILSSIPRSIDGKVFPITPNALKLSWVRACKRCGIDDLHFHDLRHEATSRLFEKGLNTMEVASITGHKTLQMLYRYTHLRAENILEKLG